MELTQEQIDQVIEALTYRLTVSVSTIITYEDNLETTVELFLDDKKISSNTDWTYLPNNGN